MVRRVAIIPALLLAVMVTAIALAQAGTARAASMPPIRHVFVLILENESASVTFAADSKAPYLAKTLRAEGAYLPNYHGIGHDSNDNYIAMISGQPPNPENQADCQYFDNFPTTLRSSYGAQEGDGCVYPADIPNIATQLDATSLTWRDYNEQMGADPSRESATCGHPPVGSRDNTETATSSDMYATRHNPFVYFHAIIDNATLCNSHVVNLNDLPADLASASTTPNYVFITPDLCDDGHDSPCANGQPGGLTSINTFLEAWVPKITSSPAFTEQNGLLIITFDEAADSDSSSCCGEIPGPASPYPGSGGGTVGPGGGDVGAVLLSPCIKPGTVTQTPYNHYTMLRSVEDIFGLSHIGYAQLPGETSFGSDIFTRRCNAPPDTSLARPGVRGHAVSLRWSTRTAGSTFTLQERRGTSKHHGAWRTLLHGSTHRSRSVTVSRIGSVEFRVRATSGVGVAGPWATRTVRIG